MVSVAPGKTTMSPLKESVSSTAEAVSFQVSWPMTVQWW